MMKERKNLIIFSTALIVLILDQLTKFQIRSTFRANESVPLIKNFLHFTYITNTGTAWGLFRGFNIFFIIFSVAVIFAIFYFKKQIKESQKSMQVAFGLLLGGTLGNFADRIFLGTVTDFIDFRIWPVFNVADSAISISVVVLVFLMWRE